MQTQPVPDRHFFRPDRRRYRINVSNHAQVNGGICVDALSPEIRGGWFAHELGHLMDYRERSGWYLLYFGLGYVLSRRFRLQAEHRADHFAIERGFGRQILIKKKLILEESPLPPAYKARIRRFNMSPQEVEQLLALSREEALMLEPPEVWAWFWE